MGGQHPILLGEIGPDSHFIELVNGLLSDMIRRVADELQSLFHAENAAFAFVSGSKTGEDLADAVTGEVHLLDGEGGNDLLLHGLRAVKLRAALRRQQDSGGREMHLRDTIQIDKGLPGKDLRRRRMLETVLERRHKKTLLCRRLLMARLLQVQHTFIRQHFGKQRSIHIAPLVDIKWYQFISVYRSVPGNARENTVTGLEGSKIEIVRIKSDEINIRFQRSFLEVNVFANW